uniref:Uncharacterized protein n=1 Tax=Oryza glaberrima TaxID=4538 RepID=I1PWN5_ORYGL
MALPHPRTPRTTKTQERKRYQRGEQHREGIKNIRENQSAGVEKRSQETSATKRAGRRREREGRGGGGSRRTGRGCAVETDSASTAGLPSATIAAPSIGIVTIRQEVAAESLRSIGLLGSGDPAAFAKYPVGRWGYNWNYIQRVKDWNRDWILLNPRMTPLQGRGRTCVNCNQKIGESSARYCCLMCKHNHVHQGKGRDMIQALAAGNYFQIHRPDRFCTICMSSFCSACCAEHIERHHPEEANAHGDQIIEVVHVDAWAAVAPSVLVPEDVLHGVQVVHAGGGALVYPVMRLEAPPAVQHVGDVPWQHNCGAPGCHEMILVQAQFCCLRCKAAVHWAA